MSGNPVANQGIVFREEFDDWALLFDPDRNDVFGLNPVSAFIWKRLDGKHSIDDLLSDIKTDFNSVPDCVRDDVSGFISDLVKKGFANYDG